MRGEGLYKRERAISTPQGTHVRLAAPDAPPVLVMCANNYLGLAQHPALAEAATEGLKRWGYGLASVRFICGTQTLHGELEQRLSRFLGSEDTILYSSCFDANAGLFETLLQAEDAVISDELNHASIIDGVRLCKAQRLRFKHSNMADLKERLEESAGARFRLIATDGVFSMDGDLADLSAICDLADRYDALVMVDDSHAVGFVGPGGRGTPEHHGVQSRVDILTGTLGKALGGASGGYTSGRKEIIETLRQRSRPYLFSNTLAPAIAAASIRAIELVEGAGDLRQKLADNTSFFRQSMTERGFDIRPGSHPIVPIMLGDAGLATRFADLLLRKGVYAVGFSYPVVPKGQARIRVQVSAAHSREDLAFAVETFAQTRKEILG
jgi:glycine C-acetyltransferase